MKAYQYLLRYLTWAACFITVVLIATQKYGAAIWLAMATLLLLSAINFIEFVLTEHQPSEQELAAVRRFLDNLTEQPKGGQQ
jgi:hypothetical protein